MPRVTEVRCVDDHSLSLVFEDGVSGVVDIEQVTRYEGLYGPLRNPTVFRAARLDEATGSVEWPHGADLGCEMLHRLVTGRPVPVVDDGGSDTP
jgi:hypothetical protein